MAANVVSDYLTENISYLQAMFKDSDDIAYRPFQTAAGTEGMLVYSSMMVDNKFVTQTILPTLAALDISPLARDWAEAIPTRLLFLPNVSYTKWEDVLPLLLEGQTLVLLDGLPEAYLADTINIETRSVEKPETESVVRGPLEAFVEKLGANLGLVRSRLKTSDLKLKFYTLGEKTQTKVCLLYIDGVIKPEIIAEIKTSLSSIQLPSIQDSAYLIEFLTKRTLSPFPLVQSTERSDKVIAALLEGRAAILVDGTPFAILLPTVFWHFFQATEDYYLHVLIGSIVRAVRFVGFFLATSLPGVYVAITTFHPEMIPLRLLFSLSTARINVPMSTIAEVLIMFFVLDLFREATVRLPRSIGPAIGIVGALVMGEAAVSAGIISPIMVIILAITAVATFAVPTEDLRGAVRLFSYTLVFLSATLGLYGFLIGVSLILMHASSLECFGVPYLSPLATLHMKDWNDTFIRAPWHVLKKKRQSLDTQLSRGGRS